MLTDGTEVRQFLYAQDACEAMSILSQKYAVIPRDKELHITSFEWVSILEVARMIAEHFPQTVIKPGQSDDQAPTG